MTSLTLESQGHGTKRDVFPIGTRVILHSLIKGAQYNGKIGVVQSIPGASGCNSTERLTVCLCEDEGDDKNKSVSVRPCNLKYEPRSIDSLTIKEMKLILSFLNGNGWPKTEGAGKGEEELDLRGMDRCELKAMIEGKIAPTSIDEKDLAAALAEACAAQAEARKATSSVDPPTFSVEQLRAQAEQMSSMSSEQLRQQALMMRSMDMETIRRMNPYMANMTDDQIRMAINQVESLSSNPGMMKMAAEQMKNMSAGDIEKVRSDMQTGVRGGISASGTRNGASAAGSSATSGTISEEQLNRQAEQMSNMTPEQMKQQAAMLKSMDKGTLRRLNPQMANMTDEQIDLALEQMESMASNPAVMKIATEQMKSMSLEDVEQLRRMQNSSIGVDGGDHDRGSDGGAGKRTATGGAVDSMSGDPSKLLACMDPKQLKQALELMKNNPSIMRQMMANSSNPAMASQANSMSDEQLTNALNMFSKMDENQIKRAMTWMARMQKVSAPLTRLWSRVNGRLQGYLATILFVIALFVVVYFLCGHKFSRLDPFFVLSREKDAIKNTVASVSGISGVDSFSTNQDVNGAASVLDEFGDEF